MKGSSASYRAVLLAGTLLAAACGDGGGELPGLELPVGNCAEIYASGFRNPWRWSFDRATGDLWLGDVGQGAREEIDRVVRGGNYGWRCFEGTLPVGLPCGSEPNLLPPVAEYDRTNPLGGRSVTGGYVYRGSAITGLAGRYVFGDFIIGRIWHIAGDTPPTLMVTSGFESGVNISSFGEGLDGELYVVSYSDGKLHLLTGPFPALNMVPAFSSLTFASPVAMLQAPGDNSRWFVVGQGGRVQVFDNVAIPAMPTVFIDITGRVDNGGEMGLLGMAFHPNFPTDPRIFLSYTNADAGRVSRISEFRSSDGGATLNPSSERILLTIGQPEANHNGGHLAFGPDGYLYIGMGDGGGGNDQHGAIGNAQLMTTLLGKMLRIDVNGGSPYAIPPDNPFAAFRRCGPNA